MLKRLKKGEDLEAFLRGNQDKTVLVKFFAEWCAPCKVLQQNIEELRKEKTDLVVIEIDADKFPELRPDFQVYSLPALFLYQQGKRVKSERGSMSIQQLREFISI